MSQATVLAVTEAALREALKDVARQMMLLIAQLDTKDGTFIRDQGKQLQILDSQLSDLLRSRTAPTVLDTLRSNLSLVLDATLSQHKSLGRFRPEITRDLSATMSLQMANIANAIADNGRDAIMTAITRSLAGGLPVAEAAGPVADALETTRWRAVVAIQRAIREMHEVTLKRMGDNQPDEFVYVYVGPPATSPNIRPYCAERVGKALTQRAADALDPQERFNCRHSLAPLPRELVEEEGLEIYDR